MDTLLMSSANFEAEVINILELPSYDNSEKIRLSKLMCSVALEHAESFKILLSAGNFTSAIGMLRSQFECYVRGLWIFYAAQDKDIDTLSSDLNSENIKRSDKLPMVSQMISLLEGSAPTEAVNPVLEFKEYSLKPLHSYVHGGLHALDRHSKGYPVELLEQALRSSNGVNGMVAMFSAVLTGNQEVVKEVSVLFKEYSECFQMKNR